MLFFSWLAQKLQILANMRKGINCFRVDFAPGHAKKPYESMKRQLPHDTELADIVFPYTRPLEGIHFSLQHGGSQFSREFLLHISEHPFCGLFLVSLHKLKATLPSPYYTLEPI